MTILADTSIWWTHFVRSKTPDPVFSRALADGEVVLHPWVYGELLLAGITPRIANDLLTLDFLAVSPHINVVRFVEQYHPRGIGWVDVNLLVACLDNNTVLWTLVRDLLGNAERHGRAFAG